MLVEKLLFKLKNKKYVLITQEIQFYNYLLIDT
jgi:hypothetical protein